MCRILSELLTANPSAFRLMIQQLESASGHPKVDIKLAGEIKAKVSQKLSDIGLDVQDTTGAELYHSLNILAQEHDAILVRTIGAENVDSTHELANKIKTAIQETAGVSKTCWSLRHSVAKRLLKDLPPKTLMKNLGYRSVDSLLKRENIDEVFAAVRFVQGERWLKTFYSSFASLSPSDFGESQLKVLLVSPQRWSKLVNLPKTQQQVSQCLPELGTVVISVPQRRYFNGVALALTVWLTHYINQACHDSTYLKLQQVKPDFGRALSNYLQHKPAPVMNVAGQSLHWPFIQQYFNRASNSQDIEAIGPHLQTDELKLLSVSEVLAKIDSELSFWSGLEYVAFESEAGPVSFNVLDVATNYLNGFDYKDRSFSNFQTTLWRELVGRYLSEERLEEEVLKNLSQATESQSSTEDLIAAEFEPNEGFLTEAEVA